MKATANGQQTALHQQSSFTAVIIIAFLAFFLCPAALIVIDSFRAHTESYYTDYITADLVIHAQGNLPARLVSGDAAAVSAEADGTIVPLSDYHAIETMFKQKDFPFAGDIFSFTPVSVFPVMILNENNSSIPAVLKVIDPASFSSVFPAINPAPEIKSRESVVISRSMKTMIESASGTAMYTGSRLFLGNRDKDLASVRSADLGGFVSCGNYAAVLSPVVYASGAFGFSHAAGSEEKKNPVKTVSLEKTGQDFYSDFLLKDQPLAFTQLQDQFYFGLYPGKSAKTEKETDTLQRDFIAVRVREKSQATALKNRLNAWFSDNKTGWQASIWQDFARKTLSQFFVYKVFVFWTAGLLLVIALVSAVISLKKIVRGYGKTGGNEQQPDQPDRFVSSFKKKLVILFGGITGAFIAGLALSVFCIIIINLMKINTGNGPGATDTVFAGGSPLSFAVSPQAVLLSFIVFVVFTVAAGIYPLLVLSGQNRLKKTGK